MTRSLSCRMVEPSLLWIGRLSWPTRGGLTEAIAVCERHFEQKGLALGLLSDGDDLPGRRRSHAGGRLFPENGLS